MSAIKRKQKDRRNKRRAMKNTRKIAPEVRRKRRYESLFKRLGELKTFNRMGKPLFELLFKHSLYQIEIISNPETSDLLIQQQCWPSALILVYDVS